MIKENFALYGFELKEWIVFNSVIFTFLILDLCVFNKKSQKLEYKDAIFWSIFWFIIALIFSIWLWFRCGLSLTTEFLSGYFIEKSLSLDNVMVFMMIFSAFKIPVIYQKRVLFWGILGALVMRMAMIWAGVHLIQKFHYILYGFGLFLIFTGLKMMFVSHKETSLDETVTWKFLKKWLLMTPDLHGNKFWIKLKGEKVYKATPLLASLILVEFSDIVFAFDSIPAIFAVTKEPFIVYTSNVFAILGLRSLYFLLAYLVEKLKYIKMGLSFILCFVGLKLLEIVHIDSISSLVIISIILGFSIFISLIFPQKDRC